MLGLILTEGKSRNQMSVILVSKLAMCHLLSRPCSYFLVISAVSTERGKGEEMNEKKVQAIQIPEFCRQC